MSEHRSKRRRRFGLSWQGALGERRQPEQRGPEEDAPSSGWPAVLSPARRRAQRQQQMADRQREAAGRRPPRPAGGDAPEPPHRVRGRWRLLALGLAVLEIAAIVLACTSPLFRVRHVDVQGAQREPAGQVVAASGIGAGTSIFLISGASVRSRLDQAVWIRSSTVSTVLPDRVQIDVEEWQPVAAYTPRGGAALYLDSQGEVLGPAAHGAAGLPPIDGPRTGTQPGQEAIDPRLLTPLVNIYDGLPGMIGQHVVRFQLDSCWNLTMVAGKGWRVLFGRMLTPSDYATLQEKVAALHSVAEDVDFRDPSVYVDVMNPSLVGIGHGQDVPPTPVPPVRVLTPTPSASSSPGARPSSSPSASPSPGGVCTS